MCPGGTSEGPEAGRDEKFLPRHAVQDLVWIFCTPNISLERQSRAPTRADETLAMPSVASISTGLRGLVTGRGGSKETGRPCGAKGRHLSIDVKSQVSWRSLAAADDDTRRIALVTGATDGIGFHTACMLSAAGYGVIVHGRSASRVRNAVDRVNESRSFLDKFGKGGVVGSYVRDFDSLDDVRALARDVLDNHPRLHLLDNNAGVFEPSRHVTNDGFERTFQVNVLAPYLLTGMLLPRLATTASSDDESKHDEDVRILNVASISQLPHVNFDNINAEQKFTSHDAYCHSKTMMKLFSFELHERISRAVELSSYDELGDHDYFAMKSGCTELATAGARGLGSVLTMSCDPGTVNTKMLLAGWGPCGIETFDANDQFELLTDAKYRDDSSSHGAYHVNRTVRQTPGEDTKEERERLWRVLEESTGFEYPI